jgi:hypothetical protein
MSRLHAQRDAVHFPSGGHFQVQPGVHRAAQNVHIAVLDVAAVFAQMHDDARGSAQFGQGRGGGRFGFAAPAGLAQGGHVIHVDAENGHAVPPVFLMSFSVPTRERPGLQGGRP